MRNIYVLGPSGIGKSTFINKYFNTLETKNIVESSERKIPENYLFIYLYLPLNAFKLQDRYNLDIEEYEKWVSFYNENRHLGKLRRIEEI